MADLFDELSGLSGVVSPDGPTESEADQPSSQPDAAPRVAIRAAPRRITNDEPGVTADARRLLAAAGLLADRTVRSLVTVDGRRHPLQHGRSLVVGRQGYADVGVDDPMVSRRHMSVSIDEGGRVEVEDLGSINGTWLHRGDARIDLSAGRAVRGEAGDWVRSGPESVLVYLEAERP